MKSLINGSHISNELLIYPCNHGIKLIRPDHFIHHHDKKTYPEPFSAQHILKLPFAVYWENTDFITQQCNEITSAECGFVTHKEIFKNPWFKHFSSQTIAPSLATHKEVLLNSMKKITYENALRNDFSSHDTLCIRMPWYNNDDKVIGIFGCSIIMGQHSLADSLTQIAELGLLNVNQLQQTNHIVGREICSVYLSKRELECLRLTIRGKTTKQIAIILGLSRWTVDEYLTNIKLKMNVATKSELIDKTIEQFFPRV